MEATERAALQLSVSERLRLIETLWESLVDEVGDELELSPEVAAELDRRLEEHRRDPGAALTWAEVEAVVRGTK